jgi:hypothetical protein
MTFARTADYVSLLSFPLLRFLFMNCIFYKILSRPSGGWCRCKEMWSFNLSLDLLDSSLTILGNNSQSSAIAISHSLSAVHYSMHWDFPVCSPFTSSLVLASNGERSPSWVPELSSCHSHRDSWFAVYLLTACRTVSSCTGSSLTSTVLSGALLITIKLVNPRAHTHIHTHTHTYSKPTNWLYNSGADKIDRIARPLVKLCLLCRNLAAFISISFKYLLSWTHEAGWTLL